MRPLLLLILPVLASCNIVVNIQTSDSSTTTSIEARGSFSDVISDVERTTFGLSDQILKKAVEKYSGGRPQDVFLHSPTPWNDLYQTYGWREVKRILKPVKSQILDLRTEKDVVTLRHFDNNSTSKVNFDASIMAEVKDQIENKWVKSGALSVAEPIIYNVNGAAEFSYTSPWGTNAYQTKRARIGSNADVNVILDPGQEVTAALVSTKVTITAQIDYAVNLSGHVACNYPKKYNGHHFWRYDINEILGGSGFNSVLNSSEVVSIDFYTDAGIVVMDKKTNANIYEANVEVKDI